MRLVRFLAASKGLSRREAARTILEGEVMVNGKGVDSLSMQVAPSDTILVRGKPIPPPTPPVVILLNKPAGTVCSRKDPHNPKTVLDLIPSKYRNKLKPVGRLDKNTTGLLLLTDDGAFAHLLTHPRHGVEKIYRATVAGKVTDGGIRKLSEGVDIGDGPTRPARIKRVRYMERQNRTVLEFHIHEGRNRQIRRMCETVGHRVQLLKRTGYGPLRLEALKPGQSRTLAEREIRQLKAAAQG